jgi:RecG-like helicase
MERGVIVASVPYQLASARRAAATADPLAGQRLFSSREALHAAEVRQQLSELPGENADQPVPIADCRSREVVDIAGTLRHVTLRPRGTTPAMEAELWDGTGRVLLVWLGRRDIPGIEAGRKIIVHGRLASVKGDRAIYNPAYELQPAVSPPPG